MVIINNSHECITNLIISNRNVLICMYFSIIVCKLHKLIFLNSQGNVFCNCMMWCIELNYIVHICPSECVQTLTCAI